MRPLYELNVYWHGSYLGFSVAEELYEVLDTSVELSVPEGAGKNRLMRTPPEITLKNVTFKYRDDGAMR